MAYSNSLQSDGQTEILDDSQVKEPPRYMVLMHNDNKTLMDFVVDVLISIFNKSPEVAENIMWNIHCKGIGECGIYTSEIAETKVRQVHARARAAGFPLTCTVEEI